MPEAALEVKRRLDAYRDERYPGWRNVRVEAVLNVFRDGDEIGWANEFNRLEEIHWAELAELEASIRKDGMRDPIMLGSDGRVWDGRHRLLIADRIGYGTVPVVFAGHERKGSCPDVQDACEDA